MNKNDFFSEVREREQKRLERSLEKARGTVLRNRSPSSNEFHNIEEFTDFEACLDRLVKIVLLCQEEFLEHLPSPLEETRGRSKWEVFLSGLKHFARRYPRGWFRRTVLPLKEWKEFPERIDAFAQKCLSGLADFSNLSQEIRKYCRNYNTARDIVSQYPDPDSQKDESKEKSSYTDLCRLYASLKTWEREENFSHFQDIFARAGNQFFEVIIEGPIQLYLFIGEDTWFLVFRVLTIESLGDFFTDKDKKELQDVKDFHGFVYSLVEKSETYKLLRELTNGTVKEYIDDFLRAERRLRRQYPTDELRRKFIRRFESGELFRESGG